MLIVIDLHVLADRVILLHMRTCITDCKPDLFPVSLNTSLGEFLTLNLQRSCLWLTIHGKLELLQAAKLRFVLIDRKPYGIVVLAKMTETFRQRPIDRGYVSARNRRTNKLGFLLLFLLAFLPARSCILPKLPTAVALEIAITRGLGSSSKPR